MSKRLLVLLYFVCRCWPALSQNIGIGTATPNVSAALDITSTTKGLLIPRMGSSSIAAISNPAKGLMVYDSVKNQLVVNMGSPAAPNWQNIVSNSVWGLTGNGNTDTAVNFIGTTDSISLYFRINNQPAGRMDSFYNNNASITAGCTYLGYGAGRYSSGRAYNTAFGYRAFDSSTNENYNTAFGVQALNSGVHPGDQNPGTENTAVGYQAVYHDINFNANHGTGTGYQALFLGASYGGTAVGYQAGLAGQGTISVGSQAGTGTANGERALFNNVSCNCIATGYAALLTTRGGASNTGDGFQALLNNYLGSYNIGFGAGALYSNKNSASQNTAVGTYSLISTSESEGNIALGYNAGRTYDNGYYNCFIGSETDATGPQYYNTIALGHGTLVTAPNMMRVGNGATTSIGGPVGWSVISDGRVKKNIRENVPGLVFINKLKPVTYNIDLAGIDRVVQSTTMGKPVPPQMAAAYKAKEQIVYTGFVAQQVEQAAKSINYDFSGVDAARNEKDLYSLRYADFVVPLVKAVQELAHQYEDLRKENERLLQQKEQALQSLTELEKKVH